MTTDIQNDGNNITHVSSWNNKKKSYSLKSWMVSSSLPNNEMLSLDNKNRMIPSILVLDGGVSTFLESQTGSFSNRELWSSSLLLEESDGGNASGQSAIRNCHETFYTQGDCDIISTITYQCHYLVCQDNKHKNNSRFQLNSQKMNQMIHTAIRLANQSRQNITDNNNKNRTRYIAASIGCYGAALANGSEYSGQYGDDIDIDYLIQFHKQRFNVFLEGSKKNNEILIDALAFETIPCLEECIAIMKVLIQQQSSTATSDNNVAVWLSFACKDELHLNDGSLLHDALQQIDLFDPNGDYVHGIGVNCCSMKYLLSLTSILAEHQLSQPGRVSRAILFYPNSGEEWDAINETWKEGTGCCIESPDDFANGIMACIHNIRNLCKIKAGENQMGFIPIIVGGCCRTTPELIQAVKQKSMEQENVNQ